MPLEFARLLSQLLRDDIPEEEAIRQATEEFMHRYERAREEKEQLEEEMHAEQERTKEEQDKVRQEDRDHEIAVAREKKPKPSATKNAHTGKELNRPFKFSGYINSKVISINKVNKDKREIEGYASVFNEPMRDHTIMGSSSFSKETLELFMTNPVLLRNHNPDGPIGLILDLKIDDKGLYCRARVDDDDTWEDIQSERMRAFSWAGDVSLYHFVPDTKATIAPGQEDFLYDEPPMAMMVDSAELLEISVVSLPNCPQALFSIVKSQTGDHDSFSLWAPIKRVNATERMVFGYAVVWGETDADGHVMLREDVEPAITEYAAWANIRQMHEDVAVGTAPIIEVDDTGLWIGVKISKGAEDCWQKILDGTYRGFSIGGFAHKFEPGTWQDDDVLFLRQISIDEISICDRPKVARATFALIKRLGERHGTLEKMKKDKGTISLETSHENTQNRNISLDKKGEIKIGKNMDEKESKTHEGEGNVTLSLSQFLGFLGFGRGKNPENSEGVKAIADPGTENAAMTQKLQTQITDLQTKLTEVTGALGEIVENAKKNKSKAAAGDDDEMKKKNDAEGESENSEKPDVSHVAHSINPTLLAEFNKLVKAGHSRLEAFNMATEAIAEEEGEEAILDILGFPGESNPSSKNAIDEEKLISIVQRAIQPVMDRVDRMERMENSRGRKSVRTYAEMGSSVNPSNSNESEEGVFTSLFRNAGKPPRR